MSAWLGVKVEKGRVTDLSWHLKGLKGQIPAVLGALTALKSLSLSRNDLRGHIPPELGNLSSLQILAIINNPHLSGEVPAALAKLTSLKRLNLGKCVNLVGAPREALVTLQATQEYLTSLTDPKRKLTR